MPQARRRMLLPFVAARAMILTAVLSLGALPARAAELQLSDQLYGYTVLDQDLRDAVRQFGVNNGLRVVLSDAVQGRVRGRLGMLTARGFLDRLSAEFGFDWFYDGFTFYVSAVSEGVNRFIPLGDATFFQLEDALRTFDVIEPRFVVRPLEGHNLVMVAGPPRFVDLVQQTALALIPKVEARAAAPPLAAAVAADARSVTVFRGRDERQISVPNR